MDWTPRGAPSRACGSGEADARRREPTLVLERMMNERPPEPVAAVPYVVIGEHGDHHLVGSRCGNCGATLLGERVACATCGETGRMSHIRLAAHGTVRTLARTKRRYPAA